MRGEKGEQMMKIVYHKKHKNAGSIGEKSAFYTLKIQKLIRFPFFQKKKKRANCETPLPVFFFLQNFFKKKKKSPFRV